MSYQVSCNRYHLGLVSSMEKNTVDRGAWWAAFYGVTQSRTQLKRPNSSSSELKISLLMGQKKLFGM